MDEVFNRIAGDLFGRLDGSLKFRFVLQSLMAIVFAIRIVSRWTYIGEALIVAPLLAFIPYVLIRGAVSRHPGSHTTETGGSPDPYIPLEVL